MDEMELYLLNDKLEKIDVLDCKSMIWSKKYCDKGDCEAVILPSEKILTEIKDGCFLLKEDTSEVMVIENIQLQTNEETGDTLIISGSSAEQLLDRRIVWGQVLLDDDVCAAAEQIVKDNLVAPTDEKRKMDIVRIGENTLYGDNIQKQITGESLLQSVIGILNPYQLGFELKYETADNAGIFTFIIRSGTDRLWGNKEGNPDIVFAERNDNLLKSDYAVKYAEYKNVCLVAGEGEGDTRKQKETGDSRGIYRREVYLDSGSLSTNDGAVGPEDYDKLMVEAGKEHLAGLKITKEFSGEIIQQFGYQCGIDFNIGDIVTILNKYGIHENVRITGKVENFDENGHNTILNFENI